MKKLLLPILMMLVLSACDNEEVETDEKFIAWRDSIGNISCTAIITISNETAVAEYELLCDYSSDNCTVTVLSPEDIAGITASRTGDETAIEYDGLMLSLGSLDDFSPINALPSMIDAIKSAHLELAYEEENEGVLINVFELSLDDENKIRLWCIAETMTPIHTEFENKGYTGIKAEIINWNLE